MSEPSQLDLWKTEGEVSIEQMDDAVKKLRLAKEEKTKAKAVDIDLLTDNGIIGKRDVVKVLGRGELKTKVDVTAHKFSTSAVEAIEKLGGKVTTL